MLLERRPFPSRAFLVGMAIIAIVMTAAGLLYWLGDRMGLSMTHSHQAFDTAVTMEHILKDYRHEYGRLPSSAASGMLTTGPAAVFLLNTLDGKDLLGDNPNQLRILTIEPGIRNRGGISFDETSGGITGLYDPWGRPYRLYLDTAASGFVRLPSGETVPGELAVIISDGPDGKSGTRDDIRSDQPAPKPGFW